MEYEHLGLLQDMFRRQCLQTPDKTAVVTADGSNMTFKQLDEATEVLATQLCLQGAGPNKIVGIYMERCLEYVVSYIAILKAGGAYMPMDLSYPATLVSSILSDAEPVSVITFSNLRDNLTDARHITFLDEGWIEKMKEENRKHPAPPELKMELGDMAYTVYSSGTTGKPKGIQCPHRGAVFSYHWRHENYPYKDDDREACNVFFVWEMLRPLLRGVTLYVIPDTVIYDPTLLCEFIQEHQITRQLYTPSLLETVIDNAGDLVTQTFKSMRTIIFCGEVVTTALLDRCIKAMPHVQFVNLYSISEAHDVTCADLTQWYNSKQGNITDQKFCPVGKLLPGVNIVILDEKREPQPVGVPGEIFVGGPTLAIGYLKRPEINKKRFIARPAGVPAKVGDRLYSTGDNGYILSDGSLEICGRLDTMVKIRGYSIEIQAVENALLDLTMVNTCAVLALGEEGQDKYLVAYIVPEGQTSKREVRAALKRKLPFYMIPSHFIFLASLPVLASSGKLDKKQLPPVSRDDQEVSKEGLPSTETERRLIPAWADVLQVKAVDVQESFFDMGGHSLLATKLLLKVKNIFDVELTVKDLFMYPSIQGMGKLIDSKKSANQSPSPRAATPMLDLIKEVALHDQAMINIDMQLRAFWRSKQYGDRWNRARVMLTGATGFLGNFLLRDLLLQTKTQIFCVVRALPDKDSKDRLLDSMHQFGILTKSQSPSETEQRLRKMLSERVTTIAGDVALNNLGLTEDEYMYLTTEIDMVIHAAAQVNLIYPYQALHGTNVLGTQNIIVFSQKNKIKPLHHISTDGVFPEGCKNCGEDADMLSYVSQLQDGYSQSKWVAEQLVQRAKDRGLPCTIYRPGNLSGDSEKACWNPQDFTLQVLRACVLTKSAPDVDWKMEMTPVDFVSSTVVSLTQKSALSLGKVFHLVNTNPLEFKWLCDWAGAHGYPMKRIPYKDWAERCRKLATDTGTNGLLKGIVDDMIRDESFFTSLSTYTNDGLLSVLKTLDISYPELSYDLISRYFQGLTAQGILPKPQRSFMSGAALAGKVAIVTGASSGIGAAVSKALAKAGCKVAIAARRLEKLQQLKDEIEASGGIALSVKTDVTDKKEVENLVQQTECILGPVDILVNNAGVMYYTMMKNLQVDQWMTQVDLNCKGMLNCVACVLNGMIARGEGHIVNMSSDAGRKGFPGLAVYSGTKFFVEGTSQAMRQELCGSGVKVTCIQPGDVKTELLTHTTDTEARSQYDGSATTKILEPEDIAGAVLFAVTQPPYAAVNEILIEPREAPV